MAFLEAAAPLLEEGGAAGAEGGGGMMGGGMLKDFNDMAVPSIAGHIGGSLVHGLMGSIGTGGGDREKANIGPVGTIA